jgi:acylphosphatase
MTERAVRHVVIRGRVQAVGFRAWMEYQAGKRGLEGWARNRRDGSVEAVFAGEPRAVGAMLEACRDGPPGAWVDKVEHEEVAPDQLTLRQSGEAFSVLPTA